MTSAAATRASVTSASTMSTRSRLAQIFSRLGTAKGGMPSAGEASERSCQRTANTAIETKASRGRRHERSPPATSGRIDDAGVGQLVDELRRHGALEHVPDHLALRAPGRMRLELPAAARYRLL